MHTLAADTPRRVSHKLVILKQASFRNVPAGWVYVPSEKTAKDVEFIASEGTYAAKGGRLQSPPIPCAADPWVYYRMSWAARFSAPGYYAVMFQEKDGKDQVDDHYGSMAPNTAAVRQEVCFRGREHAVSFRLSFMSHEPILINDLQVERVSQEEVVRWADELYATLPALTFSAAPGRLKRLPRTCAKLASGEPLRIVMLGDSIINDTNNSLWEVLLRRAYPRAQVRIITSVRGSTGCWHYQEAEHFQSYVTAQRPDLVLIGGISHHQDLTAIRAVIERTVAAPVQAEVLLMSGPMNHDWRAHDPAQPDIPLEPSSWAGDPFNPQLAALAGELGVGFFDIGTAWHQYLGGSRAPWEHFHRDHIHANDRGRQILARLLQQFFAADAG